MITGQEGISTISDQYGLRAVIRKDPLTRKNVFYKTEEMDENEILALFEINEEIKAL